MSRIICLANSIKRQERCIAGIDLETGKWVRPTNRGIERAIPKRIRVIGGVEPKILDILEIPLADNGPDEGCQPENRWLRAGAWRKIGRLSPGDLEQYLEDDTVILHNHEDSVQENYFGQRTKEKWKSLQLIRTRNVRFYTDSWEGKKKWRAILRDGSGVSLDLGITDPDIREKLIRRERTSENCILTISLATPWSPDEATPKRCYKLVAGVLEL